MGARVRPHRLPHGAAFLSRAPALGSAKAAASGARALRPQGPRRGRRGAQTGPRSQLTLEGPLGAGAVQVSAADHELEIVTSRGERLDNAAAHAELAARLGFDPPLPSLRYWILGVPDPERPALEELDE